MKWSNVFSLPQPLAEAIMEDMYYGKREEGLIRYCAEKNLDRSKIVHYSVNELIRSPRQALLSRRWDAELVKDVAMEIYRLLGSAIHFLLWASAKRMNDAHLTWMPENDHGPNKTPQPRPPYYTAEERLFYHFNIDGFVVVVSGEPDLVAPDGVIHDYKVTAVWSWLRGIKDEWEKQLNMYAMFRTLAGRVTTGLEVCFILRDWNVNETMQSGYPPAGAQKMGVLLWDFKRQQDFLMDRIRVHLSVRDVLDDLLPECTAAEMWEKETSWAVKRRGGKVASKVFTPTKATPIEGETRDAAALREATSYSDEATAKLKGKEKERDYFVEVRPGERTKCLRFCDARTKCNQFQEYAAASFRGSPDREPAEEIA